MSDKIEELDKFSGDAFTLFKPFKVNGTWWLPDQPDNKVTGLLTFTGTNLSLTLGAPLHTVPLETLGTVSGSTTRFSHIHGRLKTHDDITLYRVLAAGGHYSAIYALIGHHTADFDSVHLTQVSFAVTGLEQFLAHRGFKTTPRPGDTRGVDISYDAPDVLRFNVDPINAELEIDTGLSVTHGDIDLHMAARSHFSLMPARPHAIEWYIRMIWKMCDFLALLTDDRVRPLWLRVSLGNDDGDRPLLHGSPPRQDTSRLYSTWPLFTYASLHDSFHALLNRWFAADDVLCSAIYLYRDTLIRDEPNDTVRFLLLMQALEAFSRATTDSHYMPSDQFEKVRAALEAALPADLSKDHRRSLEKRLEFGNQYSQRKRLNELLKSLSADAQACVCKKRQDFVEGAVTTRNHLIHLTDETRHEALTGIDLYWFAEKLQMLLRIALLRWAGLNEMAVVSHIKGHPRLAQYIELGRAAREFVSESNSS